METISIIISAYNAAAYLSATLKSCLKQTLQPQEIIVVDDGSSDETADVVVSFGEKVQYIPIENGGVSRARNIGAEQAIGERLLFLDADDLLLPHALKSLLTTTSVQQAGIAYGMVIERREPPQRARLNGFDYAAGMPPHGAERTFWRGAIITPGSALVKASLHEAVGGFVSGYEPMEDRDYWMKCALLERIAFCDTVVLDKTWMPASHGSQHSKRIYRGQLAQRALKAWAKQRGAPIGWIPDDKTIIKSALDEAIWRRSYEVIRPLLQEAKELGLSHWKASLLSLLFHSQVPEWITAASQIDKE